MKKVIFIFIAAIAFSCGDGSKRSSETDSETQTEDNYPLEADTTEMEVDSTYSPGIDRQGDADTVSKKNY